jgi:hypothetical protein
MSRPDELEYWLGKVVEHEDGIVESMGSENFYKWMELHYDCEAFREVRANWVEGSESSSESSAGVTSEYTMGYPNSPETVVVRLKTLPTVGTIISIVGPEEESLPATPM